MKKVVKNILITIGILICLWGPCYLIYFRNQHLGFDLLPCLAFLVCLHDFLITLILLIKLGDWAFSKD